MSATLSLTVTESNVDQTNNTSVVKAVLKISASGATHNGYNQYGYITIDGHKYGFHHSFSQNSTTTLYSVSRTITHNTDGSKSVTVKGYYQTGVSPGNLSKSITKTLTKIPRQYTVTYNANGGSGAPGNQTKTYGVTLKLSTSKPTRSGYNFTGWKGSNGNNYAAGANYTGNTALTLTAQWSAITYVIKYNANGGSGAPGNQTKTHGVTLKLSTTVPTRTGYIFVGWAKSASTTAISYQPGGNYTGNAALNLYAIWSADYTSPSINSVNIYRCKSNGEKSLSGDYVKMIFTWTTGLQPGTTSYSTKVKVTYGSGTVWLAETTSTSKSATATLGPTEIAYTPGLTAQITVTDTKHTTDNIATRSVQIPNVGLIVDISPNENNITLFGVCDDDNEGLIVNNNIDAIDVNAENVYAGNIGTRYYARGNYTIPTAGTISVGPSITLPPGVYFGQAYWTFGNSGTGAGHRSIQVSYGIGTTGSNFTNYNIMRIPVYYDSWTRLVIPVELILTSTTTFAVAGWDSAIAHTTAELCGIDVIRIR